jgi:hypothetical protein
MVTNDVVASTEATGFASAAMIDRYVIYLVIL